MNKCEAFIYFWIYFILLFSDVGEKLKSHLSIFRSNFFFRTSIFQIKRMNNSNYYFMLCATSGNLSMEIKSEIFRFNDSVNVQTLAITHRYAYDAYDAHCIRCIHFNQHVIRREKWRYYYPLYPYAMWYDCCIYQRPKRMTLHDRKYKMHAYAPLGCLSIVCLVWIVKIVKLKKSTDRNRWWAFANLRAFGIQSSLYRMTWNFGQIYLGNIIVSNAEKHPNIYYFHSHYIDWPIWIPMHRFLQSS